MNRLTWLAGGLVLASIVACGGGSDDRDPPPGGGGADAAPLPDGGDGDGDGDSDAGDDPMSTDGPVLEIVSPTEPDAGDFSTDALITENAVSVVCRATANPDTGELVDAASVTVSATSGAISREAAALPTGEAGTFAALIDLTGMENGALSLGCSARDLSDDMRTSAVSIDTFLDLGPRVQVLAPLADSRYAAAANLTFTVTADPVAMADTGAEPNFDAVTATIGGQPIADLERQGNTYSAEIVFDDFEPALDGPQILVVRAPNTRTDTAVVREQTVEFIVDSDGPAIAVQSPAAGELVSGLMTVTASITDPGGIQTNSVVATIAGVNQFSLQRLEGDTYEGTFDTRLLGTNLVFPNLIVRARDASGNQSSVGLVVTLDNVPPVASLDSAPLREGKLNSDGLLECSVLFDPLGDDAANDGQSVPQLFEIRGRVEDYGNGGTATSGVFVPVAGVDEGAVELFLLDDETGALIVDTDGDGVCDAINPLLVPTSVPVASDEVARIDLAAIGEAGASHYPGGETFSDPAFGACIAGTEAEAPGPVCLGTPASRVIRTEIGTDPVIYSVPPLADQRCMGNAIDAAATNLADGWMCAALGVRDTLGNSSVSAPLRLCVDADLDGAEDCPAVDTIAPPGERPDCTGTYDQGTNTVDAAADCTLPADFAIELRRTDL